MQNQSNDQLRIDLDIIGQAINIVELPYAKHVELRNSFTRIYGVVNEFVNTPSSTAVPLAPEAANDEAEAAKSTKKK